MMLAEMRRDDDSLIFGNNCKVTLVSNQSNAVCLRLEASSNWIAPSVEALSRSFRVLIEKVNVFVSRGRFCRVEVEPSTLLASCCEAATTYPGGIQTLLTQGGLDTSLERRLLRGRPDEISVQEFETILRLTRSPLIVDALADMIYRESCK